MNSKCKTTLMMILFASALCVLHPPAVQAWAYCPGSGCSYCTQQACSGRGSCTACITCFCVCDCRSGGGPISRPLPGSAGLSLASTNSYNNDDALLTNVLSAFIGAYNWDVTIVGLDPDEVEIGDADFVGVTGTQLLDSMAATVDLCYTVDSTNYEITFDTCP